MRGEQERILQTYRPQLTTLALEDFLKLEFNRVALGDHKKDAATVFATRKARDFWIARKKIFGFDRPTLVAGLHNQDDMLFFQLAKISKHDLSGVFSLSAWGQEIQTH